MSVLLRELNPLHDMHRHYALSNGAVRDRYNLTKKAIDLGLFAVNVAKSIARGTLAGAVISGSLAVLLDGDTGEYLRVGMKIGLGSDMLQYAARFTNYYSGINCFVRNSSTADVASE